MPNYDYQCGTCGNVEEHTVPVDARNHPRPCHCGGLMVKLDSLTTNMQFFEPRYDPSLGHDISGRREKAQALKARGLVEAGDRVGGARDEERSTHANLIRPEPPKGITLAEVQRRTERAQKQKLKKPTFAQTHIGERKVVGKPTRNGLQMIINGKRVKAD